MLFRMNEPNLSEITIYPVKSCKGILLDEVVIGPEGPRMDRRWMIVDPEGALISQRTCPRLAMIHTALDDRSLFLSVPGATPFMLALNTVGTPCRVQLWKRQYDAEDAGDSVAKWLTVFLKVPARLVYLGDVALQEGNRVAFVDRLPLLLISEASLHDLISRMGEKIRMNRFRPNLVVSGALPYQEDSWKRIQIGEIVFRVEKPCTRCKVPGINQETLEENSAPLTTLASFRKDEKGIMFGQLLVPENQGVIRQGQKVIVLA
jgi:uncharacterized protein